MKQQQKNQPNNQGNAKSNARTAFSELAALAGLTKEKSAAEQPKEQQAPAEKVTPAPSVKERVIVHEEPKVEEKIVPSFDIKQDNKLETSLISSGAIVDGTIRAEGNIDCRGTVKGDLIAKGTITMSGKQTGNIEGLQISFSNATVEGNVSAKNHIEIDSATKITGDIRGGSILLDGQATGLVFADELVCLHKNAVLNGDIQAKAISIEQGARVSGQVKMNFGDNDK